MIIDTYEAFLDGLREAKSQPETPVEPQRPAIDVTLYTTSNFVRPGWRVAETLPMIMARQVLGVSNPNAVPFSSFRSLRARSNPLETTISYLEDCLRDELQYRAAAVDCQAVIDVRMQFGELTGTPYSQFLFATGQGTPVRLVPDSEVGSAVRSALD